MTVIPQFEKLIGVESEENHALKASYLSTTITKALAIFAGQWPHSSYAVPGGVTCDPTYVDVMQAQALIDECIRFFEQMISGMDFEAYLALESVSELSTIGGDLGRLLHLLGTHDMAKKGQSHDRFIVLGEGMGFVSGKSLVTSVSKVDVRYVEEAAQSGTTAKAVTYKKRQYEAGPLARGMVAKTAVIKSLHKRYKDSLLTRVFARVNEVAILLHTAKMHLAAMDMTEPSCTLESRLLADTFTGTGVVEAARGSLIHRTTVKERRITSYEIIVPTQWNLSLGTESEKGVAVEAMVGAQSVEEASFIFRAFDVCSVCTTQ
jgi:Ni,Fe-hydrogenase I large subunit